MTKTVRPVRQSHEDFFITPEDVTHRLIAALVEEGRIPINEHWAVLEPAAGKGHIVHAMREYDKQAALLDDNGSLNLFSTFDMIEVNDDHIWDLMMLKEPVDNVYCADFFKWREDQLEEIQPEPYPPNLIITNPPFSLGFEYAQACLEIADEVGALTCLFYRLAFLESAKRKPFLQSRMPDVYVVGRCSGDMPLPEVCDGSMHLFPEYHNGKHQFPQRKGEGEDRIRCEYCGLVKPGTDSAPYAWFVWGHNTFNTTGRLRII